MTQTGISCKIESRSFEDYVSLHKSLRHIYGDKVKEYKNQHLIATGGAGAQVEPREASGETIADCTGTGEVWVLACDTDDNAYDGESVTLVWKNTSGTEITSVAAYNTANTTTEVAFTPAVAAGVVPISCVSSCAVEAGDNVYVGVSGMVADATKRRITIVATATEAAADGIVGIGAVELVQKTDQVGTDGSKTLVFDYVTIWGELKHGTVDTDAADTTTAAYPLEATVAYNASTNTYTYTATTVRVNDFWRIRDAEFEMLATDELFIQRLTVLGVAAIYVVIKAANYASIHTRFGAGTISYLGSIKATFPTVGELLTIEITYTPFGKSLAQVITEDILGAGTIEIAERLAPGTEVKILINDGAVAGANANVIARYIEVEA